MSDLEDVLKSMIDAQSKTVDRTDILAQGLIIIFKELETINEKIKAIDSTLEQLTKEVYK